MTLTSLVWTTNCIDIVVMLFTEIGGNKRDAHLGKQTKSSILVIFGELPIRYPKRSYPAGF